MAEEKNRKFETQMFSDDSRKGIEYPATAFYPNWFFFTGGPFSYHIGEAAALTYSEFEKIALENRYSQTLIRLVKDVLALEGVEYIILQPTALIVYKFRSTKWDVIHHKNLVDKIIKRLYIAEE